MKCPKCGYLGFERVERCRNCGYDFSLVATLNLPELSIRADQAEEGNPFEDLVLISTAPPAAPPRNARASELPFGDERPDDAPLITRPSPPRPPLSVRRATPEVPRLRTATARMPILDLAEAGQTVLSPAERAQEEWLLEQDSSVEPEPAALTARFAAVAVDLVILGAIDAAVIYFTIQICGLTFQDLSVLPKGPLLAFLLVQNGGYLVAFTAGGQTLGKMVAGIKIVPARADTPLDLGHSIVRTLLWTALAVPAGLGFLSALFSRDRRGLHDRFAGTRVVRATL